MPFTLARPELDGEFLTGAEASGLMNLKGDRPVGGITSTTYSPDLEKNIALGMVDGEAADVGTELLVDIGEKKVGATVRSLPFIDNRAKVWQGIIDD